MTLPYLTAEEATALLHTMDCKVELNISTSTYETDHTQISFELIYIRGLNEFTHLRNIKSIFCLNVNSKEPQGEFIPIDWSK